MIRLSVVLQLYRRLLFHYPEHTMLNPQAAGTLRVSLSESPRQDENPEDEPDSTASKSEVRPDLSFPSRYCASPLPVFNVLNRRAIPSSSLPFATNSAIKKITNATMA